MRNLVAGGISLTGSLRRQTASQPGHNPQAPRNPAAPPAPRRPSVPRRPRAAAPGSPPQRARPGWIARWFGFKQRQRAPVSHLPFADSSDTRFTPEAYPRLSPEACAFFNTPVEECDPETLHATLSVLAIYLAENMPSELGMDAKALFSTLWGRVAPLSGDAQPDAQPAEASTPAPATPNDAVSPALPAPPIQAQGTEPADGATVAALKATPHAVTPTAPLFRRRSHLLIGHHPSRYRYISLVGRCRSRVHRCLHGAPQGPPPRRRHYAACAGPP